MSSMLLPVSVRPIGCGHAATDRVRSNVDGNRISVRAGKDWNLIRIALGATRFRARRANPARAQPPRVPQLTAFAWALERCGAWTGGVPLGSVDLDDDRAPAFESAVGHAAGQAAATDAMEFHGADTCTLGFTKHRTRPELRRGIREARPRTEVEGGAHDAGRGSMTLRVRRAMADHALRAWTIRMESRSPVHLVTWCCRTIIGTLHEATAQWCEKCCQLYEGTSRRLGLRHR